MATSQLFTKEEIFRYLGMSKSTFYRRLRALKVKTSGRLLSLDEAQKICSALGIVPEFLSIINNERDTPDELTN